MFCCGQGDLPKRVFRFTYVSLILHIYMFVVVTYSVMVDRFHDRKANLSLPVPLGYTPSH